MLLLQAVELYSPVREEGGEGEGMRTLQVLLCCCCMPGTLLMGEGVIWSVERCMSQYLAQVLCRGSAGRHMNLWASS